MNTKGVHYDPSQTVRNWPHSHEHNTRRLYCWMIIWCLFHKK